MFYARKQASKYGKETLLDEEVLLGLITQGINELLELNKESYTDAKMSSFQKTINRLTSDARVFLKDNAPELCTNSLVDNMSYVISKLPALLQEVQPSIDCLFKNFGVENYDSNYSSKERKEALLNTIKVFKTQFEILKDLDEYDEYEQYLKNNMEKPSDNNSTTGKSKNENLSMYFIIESLERKINDEKELNAILNSIQNLNMNFCISLDNVTIYPIILDLLTDTASIDFLFYLDKNIVKKNIEVWDEAKKVHNDRGFYTTNTFHKIDLIEQVTYRGSRSYLLHEYSQVLQKEDKLVRKLFQSVIYNTIENSKNSPKLPPDEFKDIKHRRFLLENTKIILGKE